RAVVDVDDLEGAAETLEGGDRPAVKLLERDHLVVERDHDRDLRGGLAVRHRHRSWKRLGLCHLERERNRQSAALASLDSAHVLVSRRGHRPPRGLARQPWMAVSEWWDPAWSRWQPEPGWSVPAPGDGWETVPT